MHANEGFAVTDLLPRCAAWYPDRRAVVSSKGSLTYAELTDRVHALANGLIAEGVRPGDHVALLFRNSIEFVVTHMGALAAGATVVPLNVRLAPPELAYQLRDSDCTTLAFDGEFAAVVDQIRTEVDLRRVISTEARPGELDLDRLVHEPTTDRPAVEISGNDPCVILYTAGTTGFPKGAVRTHFAQLWPTIENVLMCGMSAGSVVYGGLPFFHHGGWFIAPLSAFLVGGTLVVGGEGAFDGESFLAAIERERVNVVLLVPTMSEAVTAVADAADRFDCSSVTCFVSAAAALPDDTLETLRKIFPEATFYPNAYAQTEGTWLTAVPPWRQDKADTIGLPANFVRLRVVDDDGADVTRGDVGEIVVQGPGVFSGYYKANAQTASTIRDGWVRTGDLARYDADGYLVHVGRSRDMLKSGGENVYAAEVERVLRAHPDVGDAACIALPDRRWVQVVAAVVVPRDGADLDAESVTAFCREHLAGYKCPKKVFFRDDLPKSFKGEVLKHLLVDEFIESSSR